MWSKRSCAASTSTMMERSPWKNSTTRSPSISEHQATTLRLHKLLNHRFCFRLLNKLLKMNLTVIGIDLMWLRLYSATNQPRRRDRQTVGEGGYIHKRL